MDAAHDTLARLGRQHRAALTLRSLDVLAVRDVAMALGRTVGATEVLLVRAEAGMDVVAAPEAEMAAAVEIVGEPETPDHGPGGVVFAIRDPEGNLWSFGTYAGEEG